MNFSNQTSGTLLMTELKIFLLNDNPPFFSSGQSKLLELRKAAWHCSENPITSPFKTMDDGNSIGSDEAEVFPESPFDEPHRENEEFENPLHHPDAPSDVLFDISTTIDPSYIISLIRKLLPLGDHNQFQKIQVHNPPSRGPRTENGENVSVSPLIGEEVKPCAGNENDVGPTNKKFGEGYDPLVFIDDDLRHEQKQCSSSDGETAREEHGCTLWDLAANETHAELMVQNLILEVILAGLKVSQSARTIEISLGIMGNLACHDVSRKQMALTNGLIETVVDQLFLDDARSLCEGFRLISLCLQGGEGVIWAEALSPEHILSRVLWIIENTLNMELIEKSIGFLTILGSQKDVATVLLPPLMKLGLPDLLINLFAFGMSKLTDEGTPERYSVLDIILQATEALSVDNEFSSFICSSKECFKLLIDLIKFPDKMEVANSCVTAAVLIANILIDSEHLAWEISHDMDFLQGIFDIVPLASDDIEAKSALWSILARLLNCVKELNPSSLHHYISIIVRSSDMIEEEFWNLQLKEASEDFQSFTSNVEDLHTRSRVLRGIFDVLNKWKLLKAQAKEYANLEVDLVNKGDVEKLLDICRQLLKCEKTSTSM